MASLQLEAGWTDVLFTTPPPPGFNVALTTIFHILHHTSSRKEVAFTVVIDMLWK